MEKTRYIYAVIFSKCEENGEWETLTRTYYSNKKKALHSMELTARLFAQKEEDARPDKHDVIFFKDEDGSWRDYRIHKEILF